MDLRRQIDATERTVGTRTDLAATTATAVPLVRSERSPSTRAPTPAEPTADELAGGAAAHRVGYDGGGPPGGQQRATASQRL